MQTSFMQTWFHTADAVTIHRAFMEQNGFSLQNTLQMVCYVGSHSHGTYVPSDSNLDDTDYMLVVLPPARRLLGLHKWEHWTYQVGHLDVVAYSLEKYLRLVLKSNPNVLGTLYLREEDYLWRATAFLSLQENRHRLASLNAYPAFCGYAQAQLKRLEGGAYRGYMGAERKLLVDKFGYDPKNAAHLIRLWRMGLEFVETGELTVYRPDREELKAIKRGEWSLDAIRLEARILEKKMQVAKHNSPLQKEPDWYWADLWLTDTSTASIS